MNPIIYFPKKDTAVFEDGKMPVCGDGDILVRTVYSSLSAGTERANITGNRNVGIYEGPNENFPRYGGYSTSGTVVGVGKNVTGVSVGDSVAMAWTKHQLYNAVPVGNFIRFDPEKVPMQVAALGNITTFPMAAVRKTRLEIGESMLVMGLGVLGILAVAFAKAAGAVPLIAADPVPERREKALRAGADYALDPFAPDFAQNVRAITGGGANTAIEVTGRGEGLNEVLDCMAKFGRVALLGCTRESDFTVDYYRKVHGPGIELIGAHTAARPVRDSHPGYFTLEDDLRTLMRLTEFGRVDLLSLIDEVHTPDEAPEVYDRLIHDKKFPVFVQFDWRNVKE